MSAGALASERLVTKAIVYYRSLAGESYAALAARWLEKLPYAKRRLIERATELAAAATLAGIDLLAHAAAALGHSSLDAAALVFPERGKPYWPGGPEFNISHTREITVCVATCGVRVGIDIESLERVSLQALRRVASPMELELCGASGRGAAQLWTRKEAVLKAEGGSVFEAAAVTVHERYAEFRGRQWYFAQPDTLENCALAIATERPMIALDLRRATELA
jgi:phosphopantetheinyl transferase